MISIFKIKVSLPPACPWYSDWSLLLQYGGKLAIFSYVFLSPCAKQQVAFWDAQPIYFLSAWNFLRSRILSVSVRGSKAKCMSRTDRTALKDILGPKIFVRLPLGMNNWMHFRGIVHNSEIRDEIAPPGRPAVHLQQKHNSLRTAAMLWVHKDWVQSCGSTITELLCVKIRLPNTSPPAVINLIHYDSLTCFRAAIDLWSPLPPLSQCWIGSPINCIPINHSSPMFVCRSLWYD